jgi:3-methyladenine DNA glycosylase AlkD
LLEETILLLAHEKEFFIRKAIGWVLREYSKTNPDYVIEFVAMHNEQLSTLSKKEALKVVNKEE